MQNILHKRDNESSFRDNFTKLSDFEDYDDVYGDFSPGWGWIGGKRDDADPEWKVWIPLIYKIIPWVCAHIIGGQIIKYSFGCRMVSCDATATNITQNF